MHALLNGGYGPMLASRNEHRATCGIGRSSAAGIPESQKPELSQLNPCNVGVPSFGPRLLVDTRAPSTRVPMSGSRQEEEEELKDPKEVAKADGEASFLEGTAESFFLGSIIIISTIICIIIIIIIIISLLLVLFVLFLLVLLLLVLLLLLDCFSTRSCGVLTLASYCWIAWQAARRC